MTSEQIAALTPALAAHLQRFEHCFKRTPTFEHLQTYIAGLLTNLDRKSIEPIALGAEVAPRTLQEFLSQLSWDHVRAEATLHRLVADRPFRSAGGLRIGVVDGSGVPKSGDKTPGVQRQWCGQLGKLANCVVGQHLLWTDNDAANPFSCMLCSDLFLPQDWSNDRDRCKAAHIPDHLAHRPKWKIAVEQIERALGRGVPFDWITFDEEFGSVPAFWYELDRLGLRGAGEVKPNFYCWPTRPACASLQAAHASKRVDNVCAHSPVFTGQSWKDATIKDTTRGDCRWQVKAARVHLVEHEDDKPRPTDREYWLIVIRNPATGEIKYIASNAPASASLLDILTVAFARWHIEKWFERAKQEAGMDAFEVRNYQSLIRHWLCSMMAMHFLAEQTTRLRGEKSEDHSGASGACDQRAGHATVEPPLEFAA